MCREVLDTRPPPIHHAKLTLLGRLCTRRDTGREEGTRQLGQHPESISTHHDTIRSQGVSDPPLDLAVDQVAQSHASGGSTLHHHHLGRLRLEPIVPTAALGSFDDSKWSCLHVL